MFFPFQIIVNDDTKVLTTVYILNNFTIYIQSKCRLGLKLGWDGFQLRSRPYISEMVQDGASQLIINRKSCMAFRLKQKAIVLNDLEELMLSYLGNGAR